MTNQLELTRWLRILGNELDRRRFRLRRLDRYYEGNHDAPEHVKQVKLEPEYKLLLKQSITNWPRMVVRAAEERCEPTGIRFGDAPDPSAWDIWQRNYLDADSQLVHTSAFVGGRAFCTVWADPKLSTKTDAKALITPEHASNVAVAYEPGSRRRRAAALRRWQEDDETWSATLYLPDGLYKFEAPKSTAPPEIEHWARREVGSEEWPLSNPMQVVPVIEFAVNRSLKPTGRFVHCLGEFEDAIPIIDRINTTIFAELLAQAYSSFPVRALLGEPIRYQKDSDGAVVTDAAGKPIPLPPFNKIAVDRFLQVENPNAKLVQLAESNLDNYIKAAESHIRHLAATTATPASYLLGELVNISAEGMKVAESNLTSKVKGHHKVLGESWEDVLRVALMVEGHSEKAASPTATLLWKNPEIRSDAQLADAAAKLTGTLPWRMRMEYLGYSDQAIDRAEILRGSDALTAHLAVVPDPAAEPTPTAA